MKVHLLLIMLLLLQGASMAAEIDSVTPRHVALPDTVADINAIVNARINEGVDMANAGRRLIEDVEGIEVITQRPECDVDDLFTALRKSIFQSYTASWGLKGYDLDLQLRESLAASTYSLPLRDSIYRDINYLEGFSLNLKELSDVADIDGHLVGLDKLGHFFAEGWEYFEISRQGDKGLQDALAWGRQREQGLFGYTTTGIFSYADLVANFNGWRFWNRVLLDDDDPLKGAVARLFDRPYVSCDIQLLDSVRQLRLVRAWQVNRRFDLREYIDAAWDEGNNCNSYADPFIEAKVRSRMAEIDAAFSCPADAKVCVSARRRYGDFARELLHPRCLVAQ